MTFISKQPSAKRTLHIFLFQNMMKNLIQKNNCVCNYLSKLKHLLYKPRNALRLIFPVNHWTNIHLYNHCFWKQLHICVHGVDQLLSPVNRWIFQSRMTGLHFTIPLHFLFFFPSETAFLMSLHKFSISLTSGDWAEHSIKLTCWSGNKTLLTYWCIWGHCFVETHISRTFPLQHKATWAQVYLCILADQRSLVCDKQAQHRSIRNIPISWCLCHHASPSVVWIQCLEVI